jgi:protein-S-isoprenylcysteine O-methyltransferase Ste14
VTSRAPLAWTASAIGAFGVLGARPAYAPVLGLGSLYLVLQLIGAALAAASLAFLGRSFGVVAANRGIRTGGAYGVVRHPLYTAYCITFTGYTLENPSLWNVFLFLVVTSFQLVRIRTEEQCLRADPDYVRYTERVRYRLVPYVW